MVSTVASITGRNGFGESLPLSRALGDIGNLVGPFNTRCNVGKENAAEHKAAALPSQAGRPAQVRKLPCEWKINNDQEAPSAIPSWNLLLCVEWR